MLLKRLTEKMCSINADWDEAGVLLQGLVLFMMISNPFAISSKKCVAKKR